MKRKRIILILSVLITAMLLVSCSSQRFGQRKAPKGCNTCTRWGK